MLAVRNKHTVTIEISFTADTYSIRYIDSTNMRYAVCNGRTYIHKNYNVWINQLRNAIEAKFSAL